MDYLFAILLGIIEGITEYLPISSTGHLLVASFVLGFPTSDLLKSVGLTTTPESAKAFRDTFSIFIQSGAVLAVIVFYARDLLGHARRILSDRQIQRFWLYIVVAFVPAGLVGFLLRKWVQAELFKPLVIGMALILGGLVFLWLERKPRPVSVNKLEGVTLRQAIVIGLAQIVALIPGVSRSGATIVGGMLGGLDRSTATKFTFYLAIPTLGIATVYDLFSAWKDGAITAAALPIFGLGALVSFLVALVAIAWLLRFVSRNSFRTFGFYRIAIGIVIVVMALTVLQR